MAHQNLALIRSHTEGQASNRKRHAMIDKQLENHFLSRELDDTLEQHEQMQGGPATEKLVHQEQF